MNIKRLTDEEFYSFFDTKVKEAFQDTFNYSIMDVRTPVELEQSDRLKKTLHGSDRLHLAIYDENDNLAGWSSSSQFRQYSLYTHNSAVLPQYRRKGYYSALVKETIKEARALGYQIIFSNHVLANNDVIIAKLKLGFKIIGVETFDDYGSTAKLAYYLNETRAKAFDVRAGLKRPDDEMKKVFKLI